MREANPTLPRYGTDPAQAQRTKAQRTKAQRTKAQRTKALSFKH